MPSGKRDDWKGVIASLFVHALILFLFLGPVLSSSNFTATPTQGGGGAGPAGGGGGGSPSSQERLQFVRVRSDPTSVPTTPPLVPPPKIVPPKIAAPQIVTPPVATSAQIPLQPVTAGAGTGTAGTPGAGPGSGGGVGSGIGTGRGSGLGPGTGGGPGKDYPAKVRDLFLPPLPAPPSLRGFHLIAWFDVDEKGNSKLLGFNPSPDRSYNRQLGDVLKSLRFRPGVHADGTAKRDTASVEFIF